MQLLGQFRTRNAVRPIWSPHGFSFPSLTSHSLPLGFEITTDVETWGLVPLAFKKKRTASQSCVSSLCRGHANILCIVAILVYVLLKGAPTFLSSLFLSLELLTVPWISSACSRGCPDAAWPVSYSHHLSEQPELCLVSKAEQEFPELPFLLPQFSGCSLPLPTSLHSQAP